MSTAKMSEVGVLTNMYSLRILLLCCSVVGVLSQHTLEERDDAVWTRNTKNDTSIRRFNIHFSRKEIAYLKYRLNNIHEITPALEGVGFEYGFNADALPAWVSHWANKYDFAERLKYINQFPHYKTFIQGLDIHFIRVVPRRHRDCKVVPLLIAQSFPSSVLEFYKTIPHLTRCNNGIAFEVIIPSPPGLGYSDAPTRTGLGAVEIATVFKNLMKRLGHDRFYVSASDCTQIGSMMATLYPNVVLGFHSTYTLSWNPTSWGIWLAAAVSPSLVAGPSYENRMYPVMDTFKHLMSEIGYMHIFATKPDTVGLALSDSPVGLMAFILQVAGWLTRRESIHQRDGALQEMYDMDELLDNVSFYYFSGCITTTARIYAETFNTRTVEDGTYVQQTSVPTWIRIPANAAITQSPIQLSMKYGNIRELTYLDDYGHFLAYEEPELYDASIRRAVSSVEMPFGSDISRGHHNEHPYARH